MAKEQDNSQAMGIAFCMALVGVLLLWGWVRGWSDKPDPPAGDVLGADACGQYATAAGDYSDGVLTDGEFRAVLQDVEAQTVIADTPGLHDAARVVLADFTQGRTNARSVERLTDRCRVALLSTG